MLSLSDHETFGTLLRERRQAASLTQEALAERAGLSTRGIQHLEAGDARPYRTTVQALADALGLTGADRTRFAVAGTPAPRRRAGQPLPSLRSPATPDGASRPTRISAARSGRVTPSPPGSARPHSGASATAAAASSSDLPAEPNPLIGREADLAAARALLLGPTVRLVTLAGPGGTGKTRLAIRLAEEVRREFAAGICYVPLASLAEPALVLPTVAQAMGLRVGGRPPLAALREHLRDRALLLVLDNFEHLMAAAPELSALLEASCALKLLVTSRAVLRLRWEHVFYVPPLALPATDNEGEAAAAPAVALFLERARASGASPAAANNAEAAAAICRSLDGLPLAIELAAARAAVIPPEAMLTRFRTPLGRLALLAGGVRDLPARQQTLRRTIAWSHALLSAPEQTLFRCLAVFAGGATPEAIEAIWHGASGGGSDPLHGLAGLVDACLVQREEHGDELRFRMLETIREDAVDRLEAGGGAAATRSAHAAYYLALAERAEPELLGPGQAAWMGRLEREHENLRAAMAWSLLPEGEPTHGLRIALALSWFWHLRGQAAEGRRWLEALMAQAGGAPDTLRVRALYRAGHAMWDLGDVRAATTYLQESRELAQRLGDHQSAAYAAVVLATVFDHKGTYRRAETLSREALTLFQREGPLWGTALARRILGKYVLYRGDYPQARALLTESLEESRRMGDRWATGLALWMLGLAARHEKNLHSARELLEQSVATLREVDERQDLARPLQSLGCVVRDLGDTGRAIALFREGLLLARDAGNKGIIAASLVGVSGAACLCQRFAPASRLLGATEALLAATEYALPPADRTDYERSAAAARAALGQVAYDAARHEGSTRAGACLWRRPSPTLWKWACRNSSRGRSSAGGGGGPEATESSRLWRLTQDRRWVHAPSRRALRLVQLRSNS
jgi:predicted ATPase/transcriptional regulator with XRE-family HTH domain